MHLCNALDLGDHIGLILLIHTSRAKSELMIDQCCRELLILQEMAMTGIS